MTHNQKMKRIKDLMAIHVFACDWHSGQWSRGYRLSCYTSRRLKHYRITNREMTIKTFDNARRTKLYKTLESRYANLV